MSANRLMLPLIALLLAAAPAFARECHMPGDAPESGASKTRACKPLRDPKPQDVDSRALKGSNDFIDLGGTQVRISGQVRVDTIHQP